jgi:hypothetical protein
MILIMERSTSKTHAIKVSTMRAFNDNDISRIRQHLHDNDGPYTVIYQLYEHTDELPKKRKVEEFI